MEHYWPANLCPATSTIEVQDNTGRFQSPLSGYIRTVSRPGSRIKLTMNFRNLTNSIRAAMQSLFARLRGSDRVWVWDHSYRQRGVMSAPELIVDQLFEDVDNFASQSGKFELRSQDNELRVTRLSNDGSTAGMVRNTPALTLTAFVPYAFRVLVVPGRGSSEELSLRAGTSAFGTEHAVVTDLDEGLLTLGFIPNTTSVIVGLSQQAVSTFAGAYVTIPFFSLARCALVDNSENLLPVAGDLTDAAWTKTRLSIVTTSVSTPEGGTSTTAILKEDSSVADTHLIQDAVTIPSSQDDYCFSVTLKSLNRTFARVMMIEDTGSETIACYINLTTGEITNLATSGSNWINARAFAHDAGDGYWEVSLIGRKVSLATTLTVRVYIAEAANDITFTGLNQNSLIMFRANLAMSGVPGRARGTTGEVADDGVEQNLLGGIFTKGWPVSTLNLLVKGDQVQIGDQLFIVDAPVDSDELGRAFLQISPAFRDAPAHETPIIIQKPMGKFLTDENEIGWNNLPAFISGADIVLGEAP